MSAAAQVRRYASITKTEDNGDGTIQVFGVASTESVDAQGETVTKGAMQDALPDYFKHGTGPLRAMHQPIAAGFVSKAEVNAAGETEICATVVDPVEVLKVQTGVYKGFSIGGKKLPGGYDAATKTISKMKLTEISLVDRPANPEATITMWKGEDMSATDTEVTATVPAEAAAAVEALGDLLNKGDIAPQRVLELVQADIAKGAEPAAAVITAEPATLGSIRKGMYSVSRFADLICSLSYLASDAQWEAESEKDNSPVPAALAAWIAQGGELFKEMAAEEIDELIAQLKITDPLVVVVDAVELSEKATDLRKSLMEASAVGLVDFLTIGKAHMPEKELAALALADGFEKAADAVVAKLTPESDAVAKVEQLTAQISKVESERDEAITKAEKLTTERDEAIAKFDKLAAQPAPTKAALRIVVEKGVDVATEAPAKAEPIRKADGSIDHEATAMQEIKKLHQSGGQPLRSFIN